METTYLNVPDHPGYRVGSDGSLWSCWTFYGKGCGGKCGQRIGDKWRQLKPEPRKSDGRKRYTLRHASGKYTRRYGSYFVLIAFVGPKPHRQQARHRDGKCKNDAASNLEWGTKSQNEIDKRRHGTSQQGERHPKCKVKDSDILNIVARRKAGDSLSMIGKAFGITPQRVHQIAKKGCR